MKRINIKFSHLFVCCVVLASIANAGVTGEATGANSAWEWAYLFGFEAVTLMLVFGNIRIYAEARQWFWLSVLFSVISRVGIGVVIWQQFDTESQQVHFWQHEVFSVIIAFAEIMASILSASTEVKLRELLTAETQKCRNAESRNAELQHEIQVLNAQLSSENAYYKALRSKFHFLLSESGMAEAEFQKIYARRGSAALPERESAPSVTVNIHTDISQNTLQQQVSGIQISRMAEMQGAETLNSGTAETENQPFLADQPRRISETGNAENRNAESGKAELQNHGIAESGIPEFGNPETLKAETRNPEIRNAEPLNGGNAEKLNPKIGIAELQQQQSFELKQTTTTVTEQRHTQTTTLTAKQLYGFTYMLLPETTLAELIEAGMRAAIKRQEFTRQQLLDFAGKQPEPAKGYWQKIANTQQYHQLRLPA